MREAFLILCLLGVTEAASEGELDASMEAVAAKSRAKVARLSADNAKAIADEKQGAYEKARDAVMKVDPGKRADAARAVDIAARDARVARAAAEATAAQAEAADASAQAAEARVDAERDTRDAADKETLAKKANTAISAAPDKDAARKDAKKADDAAKAAADNAKATSARAEHAAKLAAAARNQADIAIALADAAKMDTVGVKPSTAKPVNRQAVAEANPLVPESLIGADGTLMNGAKACVKAYKDARHTMKQCYQANTSFKIIEALATLSSVVFAVTAAQIDSPTSSAHTTKQGLIGASLASAALFTAFAGVDLWSSCGTRAFTAEQLANERLAHLENAGRLMQCAAAADALKPKVEAQQQSIKDLADLISKSTPKLATSLLAAKSNAELHDMLGQIKGTFEAKPAAPGEPSKAEVTEKADDVTKKTAEVNAAGAASAAAAPPPATSGVLVPMVAVTCTRPGTNGDPPTLLTSLELTEKAHQELISCLDMRVVTYGQGPSGPPNH